MKFEEFDMVCKKCNSKDVDLQEIDGDSLLIECNRCKKTEVVDLDE